MFYRKYADEGDNPVDNPNIYNVEENNRLSPGLQQVVAQSTTPDNRKYVKILFFLCPVL
jgi:hypothetical protein